VAVAVALVLAYGRHGGLDDEGVLAFVGANVKAEVLHGAWWRLHASTYLHFGLLHLGLNMYMLFVLGKLVEQIFGGRRTFAIYSVAGVAGMVASLLLGEGAISLGASGAVFGVLGAAIAELALRRRVYPETWRRILLGNLLFVALANLAIGFAYHHMIDQWAHLGGFVAGGLLGIVMSPRARYGRSLPIRLIAGATLVASILSLAYAVWGASTTIFRTTWKDVSLGGFESPVPPGQVRPGQDGITVSVPPSWFRVTGERSLGSRDLGVNALLADVTPLTGEGLEATADKVGQEVVDDLGKEDLVTRVEPATPSLAPPSGWALRENRVMLDTGAEERTPYRHLTFVRLDPDATIVLLFLTKEERVPKLVEVAPRILGSVRRGRP